METPPTYKIRGTKVTSPYPVQLTPAEHRIVFTLQRLFAPENIFADYYLPSASKRSTNLLQIDCLAVNAQGIFVIESKDYAGWIFGGGEQRFWTQLRNDTHETRSFYNPVKQNASHIRALRSSVPNYIPIHSLIVFGPNATLRKVYDLPENCYACLQPHLLHTIKGISGRFLLQPAEVAHVRDCLRQSHMTPTTIVRNEHNDEITDRFIDPTQPA